MHFSDLSWSIRGTLGRKFLALAQQYDDVINFTLGDPDIPTPEGICDAAIRCIREHKTRYTASAGIDLGRVIMTEDSDRIIFILPGIEILNDGIEALEINKHNLFSKAIEKSVETLLSEQRAKCRDQYLDEAHHSGKTREDAEKAFSETVCRWLEGFGERHYEFEIRFADDQPAG